MLRFWHELFVFYHALTPTILAFKKSCKSPVFGYAFSEGYRQKKRAKSFSSHGNCLTFAFVRKWRDGGNVITVKSRYGWWWHAYWMSEEGVIYEFAPVEPHRKVKKLWHPLPPMVYEGRKRIAPVVPQEALRKISAIGSVRAVPVQAQDAEIGLTAAPVILAAAA